MPSFFPVIARRLAQAQAAASQSVAHDIQLDVALAYFNLLQAHAQLAVNADLLARDQMLWPVQRLRRKLNWPRPEPTSTECVQKSNCGFRNASAGGTGAHRLVAPGQVVVTEAHGWPAADRSVVVPLTLIAEDANLESLVALALIRPARAG